MTPDEIDSIIAEYRKTYGPTLTIEEAAEVGKVPVGTVYAWSSQGLMDAFKSRRGRHVRLALDPFVRFMFTSTDKPAGS